MPATGTFPMLISKNIRVVARTIDTTEHGPENTITSIDVFDDRAVLLGEVRPTDRSGCWIGTTAGRFGEPEASSPELTGFGDAIRWVDVMAHRYDPFRT